MRAVLTSKLERELANLPIQVSPHGTRNVRERRLFTFTRTTLIAAICYRFART